MNWETYNKLEDCFRCGYGSNPDGNPLDARKIIEADPSAVDFDDEDDIKRLIDLLKRALTYESSDGTPRYDEGVEFLAYLISKGFDINFKLERNECLILKLAETDIAPETFQKVADLGADVYAESYGGGNVLTRSAAQVFMDCFSPDLEKSESLPIYIAEHFDLSRLSGSDGCGINPLMYAVIKNKPKLADVLLKNGMAADSTGGQGNNFWMKMYGVSPLALAFRDGNVEMAKKLLDAGADETLCDAEGTPALFSLLFVNFEYKDMNVPQQIKFGERKSEMIKLLKHPDFADSAGNTLLMKSLIRYDYGRDKTISPYRNGATMRELLKCGVNVNLANNAGKRALHFAAEHYGEFIKDLLLAGAEIDAQDNDGNTALMIACSTKNEKEARLLIRKGAKTDLKNKRGQTAADIAASNGLSGVLELIL